MTGMRLYLLQRITAAFMVPLIVVHIGTVLYAVQNGLTAAEILSRTEGSLAWLLFYGLFVVCASLHGSIGLKTVLEEWTPLGGGSAAWVSSLAGAVLAVLGFRAVVAVTL